MKSAAFILFFPAGWMDFISSHVSAQAAKSFLPSIVKLPGEAVQGRSDGKVSYILVVVSCSAGCP